jgi:hypothetical protein
VFAGEGGLGGGGEGCHDAGVLHCLCLVHVEQGESASSDQSSLPLAVEFKTESNFNSDSNSTRSRILTRSRISTRSRI